MATEKCRLQRNSQKMLISFSRDYFAESFQTKDEFQSNLKRTILQMNFDGRKIKLQKSKEDLPFSSALNLMKISTFGFKCFGSMKFKVRLIRKCE